MSNTAKTARRYANYVNGRDLEGRDGATFESINPTTGAAFGQFVKSSASDVDAAVRAAHAAFEGPWGKLSPTRRGRLLMNWGEVIAEHADRIATIETEQNGKLFAEMRAQAGIAQDWLYYFGGLADKIEGTVIPLDRQSILNYTLREPLGVVGVITPWNSPTFITIMSVAPALAAGNTDRHQAVRDHLGIGDRARAARRASRHSAGRDQRRLRLPHRGRSAGAHPLVAKVSFTGSVRPVARSPPARGSG